MLSNQTGFFNLLDRYWSKIRLVSLRYQSCVYVLVFIVGWILAKYQTGFFKLLDMYWSKIRQVSSHYQTGVADLGFIVGWSSLLLFQRRHCNSLRFKGVVSQYFFSLFGSESFSLGGSMTLWTYGDYVVNNIFEPAAYQTGSFNFLDRYCSKIRLVSLRYQTGVYVLVFIVGWILATYQIGFIKLLDMYWSKTRQVSSHHQTGVADLGFIVGWSSILLFQHGTVIV